MNLVKWVLNKKKIESEIESQDNQYETLLIKYGRIEKDLNKAFDKIEELEKINLERLETISKLRKKSNQLRKELKELKEVKK